MWGLVTERNTALMPLAPGVMEIEYTASPQSIARMEIPAH